jgi:voltage-gated potassium channel
LAVLGLVFLAVYAWPILHPDLPHGVAVACTTLSVAIWIALAADYLIRLATADHRLRFVGRNWLDLLCIALPMLRPLRAVRSVLALRTIARGRSSLSRRNVVATVGATVLGSGVIAALAMLDAERESPTATITTFGDALWWAISTITTVGYGDRYPTTTEGRLVAAALMLGGIALLGVVSASLASWFVERLGDAPEKERRTQVTLDALLGEVASLRRELEYARQPNPAHQSGSRSSDHGQIGTV